MANTVFGPYVATTWVDGTTAANQTRMNNLETESKVALNSFNADLIGAGFVLSGCAASGTVGTTTVNIGSGTAYLVMSDGTLGKIAVSASTETTATPSTTYHLWLQPDGTFYWSTSNSPAANSLHLADVATNGSGQISTITDQRVTSATLLPNLVGQLTVPVEVKTPTVFLTNLVNAVVWQGSTTGNLNVLNIQDMAAGGKTWLLLYNNVSHDLQFFNTTDSVNAFDLTPTGNLTLGGKFLSLAGQATAGSYGVAPVVAQTLNQHVTSTAQQTIVSLSLPSSPTGYYRVSVWFTLNNGTNNQSPQVVLGFVDPNLALGETMYLACVAGAVTILSGGNVVANGSYACFEVVVPAYNTLTVKYTDGGGTPNDYVSCTVERVG